MAAGQAPAACGDVARNVATAVQLTREAGEQGVRLLALPEAFLTNYCAEAFAGAPREDQLAELLAPLTGAAREAGATVVLCSALQREGRRTLSSVVVDADGSVGVPYDKQHLSGDLERDHFVAGAHGASVDVDGWEVALSVCYDGSFPEHARAAADDGAHLYVNTAAFFVGGEHRRDTYYPARALDNGIFVLFSGATGGAPTPARGSRAARRRTTPRAVRWPVSGGSRGSPSPTSTPT